MSLVTQLAALGLPLPSIDISGRSCTMEAILAFFGDFQIEGGEYRNSLEVPKLRVLGILKAP